MNQKYKKLFMHKLIVVALLTIHVPFLAQDNNYWNMQFGAKSSLLGGAVVGGYTDNGAMYYNPGALNFKDSANINVSANLYKVERMNVKNALGDKINLSSYNFDVTPQLISGTRKLSKHVEMGGVFLTHNDVDITFQQAHSAEVSMKGAESDTVFKSDVISDFDYRNRINEQWFGVCFAFSLTPKLAIGFTHFFTYRFQRYSEGLSVTTVSKDTGQVHGYKSQYDYRRDVRYDILNTMAKFGIIYKPSDFFHFGFTMTVPSINVFGRGRTYTSVNSSYMSPFYYDSYTVFDRQKGLNAQYQTPLSLALGFKTILNKIKVYGTIEYFAPTDKYDIINPKDSLSVKRTGVQYNADDLLGVEYSAKAVLNAAVGLEYQAFKKFSFLTSFRTDYNTQKNKIVSTDNNSLATSYMDLYHTTLGCVIKRNKKSIIIGLSYSFGKALKQAQFADFNHPTFETNLLGETSKKANYFYKSLGLVFGITL